MGKLYALRQIVHSLTVPILSLFFLSRWNDFYLKMTRQIRRHSHYAVKRKWTRRYSVIAAIIRVNFSGNETIKIWLLDYIGFVSRVISGNSMTLFHPWWRNYLGVPRIKKERERNTVRDLKIQLFGQFFCLNFQIWVFEFSDMSVWK